MLFQQSVPGAFDQPHNNTLYNQKHAYQPNHQTMIQHPADNSTKHEVLINSINDLNVATNETWKERKDPFTTNSPTSTLVDFETIAPPPPSKRLINDDSAVQYAKVATQNHQFMDIARSSASRFGHTLHDSPHVHPSISYGSVPALLGYQPTMASASSSTLPLSNHLNFQQQSYPVSLQQYQQLLQQQQLQTYSPSIMVPPQSPTLASYYFEGSNSWFDQYQDPKRLRSPSAHVDTDYAQMMQQRQQWHSMNAAAANLMVGHGFADVQAMQQWLLQQQQNFQLNPQASLSPMYQTAASNSLILNDQQMQTIQQQQQALLMQQMYSQQQQQQILSSMGVASTHPQADAQFLEHMQRRKSSHKHAGSVPRASQPYSSASMPHQPQFSTSQPSVAQMLQAGVIDPSEASRDQLLAYAHTLYASTPYSPNLLELLHLLNSLHPTHLPTLLLLACVYFTQRNYQASLHYNQLILKQDPQYVEAMSNIGTTLRSMGRTNEAEQWWYQAVKLRPGYWDAVENLVGVLCTSQVSDQSKKNATSGITNLAGHDEASMNKLARFREALNVCDFVEQFFFKSSAQDADVKATTIGRLESAIKPPKDLPRHQIPRLQNLFYAKGNLKYAMGDMIGARNEYEKGLEVIFGGKSLLEVVNQVACAIGSSSVAHTFRHGTLVDSNALPLVLLHPDQATRLLNLAFPETGGVLPGLAGTDLPSSPSTEATTGSNVQQAAQTTSTILLTLAKMFQDMMNPSASASPNAIAAAAADESSTKPTMSVLLPLYYLSLCLNPSPSTANNLGIILSNISGAAVANAVVLQDKPHQQQAPITGTSLALQYYTYGLQLDPRHPHLYTNLGSLLKELGHLNEAVRMYEKAVECNPRFDVALANLGNAIKDMGRVQESVQWYKRAVEVNANFVDAVCGLVNALGGVCDWRGRGSVGDEHGVDQVGHFLPTTGDTKTCTGWIGRVVEIVEKQLNEGIIWGAGVLKFKQENGLHYLENLVDSAVQSLGHMDATSKAHTKKMILKRAVAIMASSSGKINEGSWIIRLIERTIRRTQRSWYIATYGTAINADSLSNASPIIVSSISAQKYKRPTIPSILPTPTVPTVLPFHTFTYPLSPRQIRLISHRNALRISHSTLTSSWVPDHVYSPPPPPAPRYKIGYISSDFNNHPLAHLMQSVFGFHDKTRFEIFCYATTASDGTPYRQKIERETEHFLDVSTWNNQQIVDRLHNDGIHILINLNGYTKGARNEIMAARPCPVQCSFMGFAGTLAGGWCDWVIADPIVCPPEMVSCEQWRYRRVNHGNETVGDFAGDIDPESSLENFVYTEKFIYMPHSYFVNDHKQGFREEEDKQTAQLVPQIRDTPDAQVWEVEEAKRWKMRREVFPDLPDDVIIFANFNQLYKLEPGTFRLWLRILERVPSSIIWLLRFPPAGEANLLRTALEWCGPQVAQRVVFTDVAPKHIHIHRGRVADLFLDTPECNAHTTAADILWSGTPILTWPKYMHKMCSRVGASIARATSFGDEMIVHSEKEYEERAVALANSLKYKYVSVNGEMQRQGKGSLHNLRKRLFTTRDNSRLFDTIRWTRNLETGYVEAWKRWVNGEEFEDINGNMEQSGCIWVTDPDDAGIRQ